MTSSANLARQAASIIPSFFEKLDEITAPAPFSIVVPMIGQFRQMQFVCNKIKDSSYEEALLETIASLRAQILKPSQVNQEPPAAKEYSVEEDLKKLARFEKISEFVLLTLANHPHFQSASSDPFPETSYFTPFGSTLLKTMYEHGTEAVESPNKSSSLKTFSLAEKPDTFFLSKTIPVTASLDKAALMKLCYHPNILPFGMITNASETEITFTLPLTKEISLGQIPFSKKDPTQVLEILLGCLRGLSHMHSCNIVHNEITLENLHVQTCGDKKIGIVTNFDSATLAEAPSNAGSADYDSPEFVLSEEDLPKRYPSMDVWAFGVVLFEIVWGRSTFFDYVEHTKCDKSMPEYWTYAKKLFYSEKATTQEQLDQFLSQRIETLKGKKPSKLKPELESFLYDACKMCLKLAPEKRCSAQGLFELFETQKVTLEMADLEIE